MANSDIIYAQFDWAKLSRGEQLDLMDEYYSNNDLYEATRLLRHWNGVWNEDIRPLRSPVHRSVDFFVSKIAVGEPVIGTKNTTLKDAVAQILDWSNFQSVKPTQIRTMAKYGGSFRKALTENGKARHELLETKEVTSVKHDTRGHVTEIRIDTPIVVDGRDRIRTEFWTVNASIPYMSIWIHGNQSEVPIDRLGDPEFFAPLSAFGIDFVPIVHDKFADDGGWGASCVQHALLKVDESNRMATKLHQNLYRYNKPLWLISANQTLPDGTVVPAPKFSDGANVSRDNSVFSLPGLAKLDSLIPPINYKDALEILQSQEKELQQDLPELLYFAIPDRADLSGKALRQLLGAAIDRRTLAENNYLEGTVRLNQMCITLGQFQGIFDSGLGTFDSGQTNHSLRFQDPFQMDVQEQADALNTFVSALGRENLKLAMQKTGFSEEEIASVTIPQPVVTPPQE